MGVSGLPGSRFLMPGKVIRNLHIGKPKEEDIT